MTCDHSVHYTYSNGAQQWQNQKDEHHRTDGPAVIHPDGSQEWCLNGVLHRTDGPAMIHPNGNQRWYLNGELHRTDGPAVIHPNGNQRWYLNGELHRPDGPAVIYPDGTQGWYVNGEEITHQVQDWMKLKGVTWPWDTATQMEFVLTFL